MGDDTDAFSFRVDSENAGTRLDALVALWIPACSRSFAAELIRRGEIRVLGAVKKPGYRLKAGETISGRIPPPEPARCRPEPVEMEILHEDDQILVINKPANLVIHPAPGHPSGTLVNGILHRCPDMEPIGGERRPGIVHRLDKDTTGTLVVAKTPAALAALSDQFKGREVRKRYLALVQGSPRDDGGTVTLPIGRHPVDRKRMSTVSPRGRDAVTEWRVVERFRSASLLEVGIHTGRTHQIRVHCAAMGHPVVGDPLYGRKKPEDHFPSAIAAEIRRLDRQMLHAQSLAFRHPSTGTLVRFESPVPADMAALIGRFRNEKSRDPLP